MATESKNVFPENTEQSLPSALLSIHQQAFDQLSNTMSETASETWQDVKAIDKEYAVTQRALGGLKGVGGLAEAAIGAIGVVAPEPLTSIGGVVLMAHGSDVAASGFNELWTGKPQETFTDKAVTATAKVLGASDATAHQIGDGVDMGISFGSAGVGFMQSAARGLSATQSVKSFGEPTIKPLREKIEKLSLVEQRLVREFNSGFTPKGVSKEDALEFILNTRTGNKQLSLAKSGDPSANNATILNRVLEQVQSGVSVPIRRDISIPLVKIVPESRTSAGYGPFFTTQEQLRVARKSGKPLADVFGLPGGSDAGKFRVFQIEPKTTATVFESTIAPTTELGGKLNTQGGLQQFLVPNRNQFEDAIDIGIIRDNF